jgi:hypothetical protein
MERWNVGRQWNQEGKLNMMQEGKCKIYLKRSVNRPYTIWFILTYSMKQSSSCEADQSLQLVKKFPAFY